MNTASGLRKVRAGTAREAVKAVFDQHSTCPNTLKTDSPFWPHLLAFVDIVGARVSPLPPAIGQSVVDSFLHFLANRLDFISRQVLLFETAVRRAASGENFAVPDLVKECHGDVTEVERILHYYPALAEISLTLVDDAVDFFGSFVSALAVDWGDVARSLDRKELAIETIGGFILSPSETHCGGQVVITVTDCHNVPVALYKPRCLAIEARMTELIRTLAAVDSRLDGWILPRYVLRVDYGWVEFIEHKACSVSDQVDTYFYRCGALTAIAVALGITDLHRDNLIAHESSPVPVDLEAALHHRRHPEAPSREGRILPKVMEWNSLGTGLLPIWMWKGDDLNGVELSGLGGLSEQWCSLSLEQFSQRGLPSERVVHDGVTLYVGKNLCRLHGQVQAAWNHIDQIQEGFRKGWELTTRSGAPTLAAINDCLNLPVRFLARPTAGYHYAMQASLHPKYMRSVDRRMSFLEDVLNDRIRIEPWLIEAEVGACMACDIPRFVTRPFCLEIEDPTYGAAGLLPADEFMPGGHCAAEDAKRGPWPERLLFECKVIRGSLLALRSANDRGQGNAPLSCNAAPPIRLTSTILHSRANSAAIDAARFIGSFVRSEFNGLDDWYGFRAAPGGHYEFGLIGVDLYSGMAGILYAATVAAAYGLPCIGPDELDQVLSQVENAVRRELRAVGGRLGGAYCGPLSAVLPLAYVHRARGRDDAAADLLQSARVELSRALSDRSPEQYFWGPDLLGGTAGALAVATCSARMFPDARWLSVVEQLVELLAAGAVRDELGLRWPQPGITERPADSLTGFSHGQAGIAWALAGATRLNGIAIAAKARDLAQGAVEWELGKFDPAVHNWPDYRKRATRGTQGEFAWSHGAPGILLAIAEVVDVIEEPHLLDERLAVDFANISANWIDHGPACSSPCLCHGALGIYCLMTKLAARFGLLTSIPCDDKPFSLLADRCQLASWAEFETRELRRAAIDAPGLMIGRGGSLLGWIAVNSGDSRHIPFTPSVFEELPPTPGQRFLR